MSKKLISAKLFRNFVESHLIPETRVRYAENQDPNALEDDRTKIHEYIVEVLLDLKKSLPHLFYQDIVRELNLLLLPIVNKHLEQSSYSFLSTFNKLSANRKLTSEKISFFGSLLASVEDQPLTGSLAHPFNIVTSPDLVHTCRRNIVSTDAASLDIDYGYLKNDFISEEVALSFCEALYQKQQP